MKAAARANNTNIMPTIQSTSGWKTAACTYDPEFAFLRK